MMNSIVQRNLLTVLLLCAYVLSLPIVGLAQTADQQSWKIAATYPLSKSLSIIEEKTDLRRIELGIPGMSLAIVKDGKVIYAKGLGYKDFENKVPATADTQF